MPEATRGIASTIPADCSEQDLGARLPGARYEGRVLLVAPSLRIMGGQAVCADQLLQSMRADGVHIDFQPINPLPPWFLRVALKVKGLRTLVVSAFYIASLLRRVPRYDVIHIFSASYLSFLISQAPAIVVAWCCGKPSVLNYHSGEAEDHLRRWQWIIDPLLRRAGRIVVQTEFLVDVFRRFGFEARAIPNVVDERGFAHRVVGPLQPKILVARALEPLYNIDCAIRAFQRIQAQCPQAEMTILGDGSQRSRLERLVADMRLQGITFTGRVERDRIGEFFASHDLFLNSSSIDNMPVSILEAFASGLPIVTTNAGGIPYLIHDRENGHLVDIDDDRALAERVLQLVADPAAVESLSRSGAREIEKYRWERVARLWYEVYQELAPKRRESAADCEDGCE